MVSRSTGVLSERSPAVDEPARVIRRAKRRVEPEAVNTTPCFTFVWPAVVVQKQVAGTGPVNLLRDRYRRMVRVDAAARRHDRLADREALSSLLTEGGCLLRQLDKARTLENDVYLGVLAKQREWIVRGVCVVWGARVALLLEQLRENYRGCEGVKGWQRVQIAKKVAAQAAEDRVEVENMLAALGAEKIARRAAGKEKRARMRAAGGTMLAVRARTVRRKWWQSRWQLCKELLVRWRTKLLSENGILSAVHAARTRIDDWKKEICSRRERFRLSRQHVRGAVGGSRRQGSGAAETAPSAPCATRMGERVRTGEAVAEVRLLRARRGSERDGSEVWEHTLKSWGR
jgi:hypothetical protein